LQHFWFSTTYKNGLEWTLLWLETKTTFQKQPTRGWDIFTLQGCSFKVSLVLCIGYLIFSTLKICKILLKRGKIVKPFALHFSSEFGNNCIIFFLSFNHRHSGTKTGSVAFRCFYCLPYRMCYIAECWLIERHRILNFATAVFERYSIILPFRHWWYSMYF